MSLLFRIIAYPPFEDTSSVPVEVIMPGHWAFGIGEWQHYGGDNNGQSKVRWQGELIITPNGDAFRDHSEIHFAVDENAFIDENFTFWV